jgi:hypothetical protein
MDSGRQSLRVQMSWSGSTVTVQQLVRNRVSFNPNHIDAIREGVLGSKS